MPKYYYYYLRAFLCGYETIALSLPLYCLYFKQEKSEVVEIMRGGMWRQPVKHANNDFIGIWVCYRDINTIFIELQIEKDDLKIKKDYKRILCYLTTSQSGLHISIHALFKKNQLLAQKPKPWTGTLLMTSDFVPFIKLSKLIHSSTER